MPGSPFDAHLRLRGEVSLSQRRGTACGQVPINAVPDIKAKFPIVYTSVRRSTVNETEEIADRIHKAIPHVKKGSLRFWGEWFGRPHDNIHTLVRGEVENGCLRLLF